MKKIPNRTELTLMAKDLLVKEHITSKERSSITIKLNGLKIGDYELKIGDVDMNAKKMFEELGYELEFIDSTQLSYSTSKYHNGKAIQFNNSSQTFRCSYDTSKSHWAEDVTVEEYKAITQQMIELGWLDEQT